MDGDTLQSPGRTSKRLIEYSAKRSTNYLGYDLNEEQSIFSQSPRQTMNLNDMEPFSSERISLGQTPSKSTLKPERKKIEKILSKDTVQEEDSFDIEMDIFRFEINGQQPDEKSFTQDSRIEALSPAPLKDNSRTEKKALSRLDIVRREQSLKMDRLNSLRSNYSSKKSGAGSFLSEAEPVSQSFGASKMLNAAGKPSLVNFVAMARRMGLLRRVYAYEDYMSVEQFNMIKDLSTGRFDSKEEKRTEQMARLKSKLMVEFRRNRTSRRKTHLINWKENLLPSLKRMYRQFKESVSRVIVPNGLARTLWDIFIMLLIFYDVIMVPLTIAFDVPLPGWLEIWDIIMTICYILDILLNFNTGFYDKGLLVLDRHRIFFHYIKSWFIFDMIASFPYEYVIHNEETESVIDNSSYQVLGVVKFLRFIRVFRFIRIFKLKGIFIKMESFLDMSNLLTSVIGFLKLSFIILFIAHWFACIWHFIALLELESKPETWLTKNDLIDAKWEDRYIASIYWATTTMITVGYGDIVPTTVNEQLVAILAMLVASAVFAYTMNRINLILTGLENTSEQYQKASSTITEYMRKKHVKKELQIKIKKYLEYALEVETSLDSNEAYLSAYLNQSLKNELITEIHSKTLLENLIFRRFDSSLIMKTSLIMKEKIYSPEDPVFFENEIEDPSIYIIHSGKIEIFNFKANAFLRSLTRGNYFGEISFFTGQARSASARSTDFSALYYVRRNEFLDIMDEFPVEKERFHELKDKMSIYENQQVVGMRCYSCESPDHLVKNCPKVHLVIPKTLFIESYINQRNKFMNNYIRLGARSARQVYSYSKMAVAARRIQVRVWEGELVLDKSLNRLVSGPESPEYTQPTEHPSILFARNKSKIITGSPRVGEVKLTRKSVSVEPRKDNISIDIEVHVAESAVNDLANLSRKLDFKKKSVSIVSNSKHYIPSKPSQKKSKKHTFFDDIDRIHNFVHYFPHNNFEIQFPTLERRRKTAYFDYFSHTDTTKATLKRFVAILRERVRLRKELERDRDLSSPERSPAPSRFSKQSSPTRSRFFPGKSMLGESPQPSRNDIEESRNDVDHDDSRSYDNTN